MPASGNNGQQQNGTQQNTAQNGDILAQLVANHATTKDVYMLEKGMNATLGKIEKNQNKANTVLSDINKEFKDGHRVLSSVDTKLQQIINKISQGSTNNNNNQGNTDISKAVNNIVTAFKDNNTYLASIKDILRDVNTNVNGITTNTNYLAEIKNILQNLNIPQGSGNNNNNNIDPDFFTTVVDKLNSIDTSLLDNTSYVNDCSSYLDEIRELLKNIDDRGANPQAGSGTPKDSATDVDSFKDLNNTLLLILAAVEDSNDLQRQLQQMFQQYAGTGGSGKRDRSSNGTNDSDSDDDSDKSDAEKAAERAWKQMEEQEAHYRRLAEMQKASEPSEDVMKMFSNWGTGQFITKDVIGGLGGLLGDAANGAISAAIPVIGPIIGQAVDNAITKVGETIGDYVSYLAEHTRKTRDEIIKQALDKIKKDVKDMATYSITIQETSLEKIYNAWDQNMSVVNATQGYTKEALNSLQDSVAQRLQREGYGSAINAADYMTQLTNTLNAKLGGELAEAFAAQNLILQKAVPELDLSSMAADFAAIYTNAEKQGESGENAMIIAMNEIAGATKALEQVTGGNNQFITQVGNFLKKAEEVVNRSGGTADQIAHLTTQMMAAEAPLSALVPQLAGFTNTIVDSLMNSNESTAVALRAIMHDIDSTIGISMTDFTKSFMEDTQGTLATAYKAIEEFISNNENAGARQEFLTAMQSIFGLQANQIAQIDFGQIAEEISNASTQTNIRALTDAENLVKSGETTSWEDQLVNNTTNQLLATNAVRDTIDNKLMRKLEKNELTMEAALYELEATQTVDFAEKTITFLTNIADIITGLLDPLGLLTGLTGMADVFNSYEIDKASYNLVTTASQIGSTVTTSVDEMNADLRTYANTWGTAQEVAVEAMSKSYSDSFGAFSIAGLIDTIVHGNDGQSKVASDTVQQVGITDTFSEIMSKNTKETVDTERAIAEAQAREIQNQNAELQAQRLHQEAVDKRKQEAEANQASFDTKRLEALQQQKAMQEAERTMTTANHDNIEAIRESVSRLDELSNYLSPILDENKNQSSLLQTLSEKVDQLIQAVANKAVTTNVVSPTPNVSTAYNERDRIYGPIKTW